MTNARERAAEILAGITYRPRWEFRIVDTTAKTFAAQVNAEFADPDGGDPVLIYELSDVSAMIYTTDAYATDFLLRTVWALIERVEAHERLEHLRRNGEHVWAPHERVDGRDVLRCAPHGLSLSMVAR